MTIGEIKLPQGVDKTMNISGFEIHNPSGSPDFDDEEVAVSIDLLSIEPAVDILQILGGDVIVVEKVSLSGVVCHLQVIFPVFCPPLPCQGFEPPNGGSRYLGRPHSDVSLFMELNAKFAAWTGTGGFESFRLQMISSLVGREHLFAPLDTETTVLGLGFGV